METGRQAGTIRAFNVDKGYGFIRKDDNSEEFFHISECKDFKPIIGTRVEFNTGSDRKSRTKAIDITSVTSGKGEHGNNS